MSVQALSSAFAVRGVNASEKLVLLALANYADRELRCWPSQKTLSEDTELGERTVWGALKGLEARGLLTRKPRYRDDGARSTDVFTLNFDATPLADIATTPRNPCDDNSQDLRAPLAAVAEQNLEPNHQIEEPVVSYRASKAVWIERVEEAKATAGTSADLTAGAMHHAVDLRALVEPASGEPCTWDEVLAAIQLTAHRQARRGKLIRSWSWVADDAWSLRDKRLNAVAPAPVQGAAPTGGGRSNSFSDQLGADQTEARRRALEMMEAERG